MNKTYIFCGICLLLGLISGYLLNSYLNEQKIIPIFSPQGGESIIDAINNAKESIYIETYVFTSDEVLAALISAKNRGVIIEVIIEPRVMDDDNSKMYSKLANAGINVRYASIRFQLTHAKFIIIDGKIVIVGSHNLTNAALNKNREASILVYDRHLASVFLETFNSDWFLAH
jgi:phosphatidylserine/phosphatidylglycerophosphate/cardiolipin synthase-like enzyme